MRVGIIGTRGIPNNYGGFEQFAEYLSVGMARSGHDMFVYCAHNHRYQKSTWRGVQLIHIKDPEKRIGTWGQFIYDLLCILDSRKRKFDIIYQLGYTSSSIWGWLLPKASIIVTNMDGLEWKRTKYRRPVRRFLKYAEKLAVYTSDHLVADSTAIQVYLAKKYKKDSEYLPYGTNVFDAPDANILGRYGLSVFGYNMLIARLEPENNIEVILEGVKNSAASLPFLVIGNWETPYGRYLESKFKQESRIRFLGPNYDIELLNNLRYYSRMYFHGHSVGGTNPSLLEAMGSQALICAHRNAFNEAILGKEAYYFSDGAEVSLRLDENIPDTNRNHFVQENLRKVQGLYLWPKIVQDYESYFSRLNNS